MTKKKSVLVISIFSLFVIGCTSPSQKLAAVALDRGMGHMSTIEYDLVTLAKQQVLDLSAIEIKNAIVDQDEVGALAALEKSFNTLNKIGWLQIEFEKAKSYVRLSGMYISSQQGVLDLLYKDFQKAKAAADAASEK
jgi:hypothetical protein